MNAVPSWGATNQLYNLLQGKVEQELLEEASMPGH